VPKVSQPFKNLRVLTDFLQPVLDILAEMIAADSELNVGPFGGGPGSDSGIPGVGLD
jgi:hypothetical protein